MGTNRWHPWGRPSVLFNGQRSQVWQDMVPLHTTETPGCLLGLVVLLSSSSQDRGISNFPPALGRDDPFNCRNAVKKGDDLGQDF